MLIPLEPDIKKLPDAESRDFFEQEMKKKREAALVALRSVPGLLDTAKMLNADGVYKLVSPKGAVLQYDPKTKLYDAVLRGSDGKIVKHPKFKALGPDFVSICKSVGAQILLVQISLQLMDIRKGIDSILLGQHDDRVGNIEAGISQYKSALLFSDPAVRNPILANAIQSLELGINQTVSEVGRLIKEAPDPKNRLFDHINPLENKLERAESTIGPAREGFIAALEGLQVLCQCYAALSEPMAAQAALEGHLRKIGDKCDIEDAIRKSRLLEPQPAGLPQVIWKDFAAHNSETSAGWDALGDMGSVVEIEFRPRELLGVKS